MLTSAHVLSFQLANQGPPAKSEGPYATRLQINADMPDATPETELAYRSIRCHPECSQVRRHAWDNTDALARS
eukprot:6203010-Pleurochrysis_carterae.AAC.4